MREKMRSRGPKNLVGARSFVAESIQQIRAYTGGSDLVIRGETYVGQMDSAEPQSTYTAEKFGPVNMSRYASTSTDLCWATIVHEGGREEHDIRSKAATVGTPDGTLQGKTRTGISKSN